MKKNLFKKFAAILLSGSLSIMNIPVSFAADENDISQPVTTEVIFQEIRMLPVEEESSEYGERSVRYVDENGNEIVPELYPRSILPFYSLFSLLPSKYDLREQNQLPDVRNQYDTSTCWAHAALAASETNLIKKGLADTSVDLSEAHLVWFGNCSASTDTSDPLFSEGWNYGVSGYDDIGGYSVNAAGVLARGSGIEFESNTPSIVERPVLPESQRYVSHGYLQNSDFLDNNDQNNIKKHIMNTGALMVSYYSKDTLYYDKTHCSYYDPNNDDTNHAVTIVGWDDDFSRYDFGSFVPEGDGAWICRNSWGTSYGEDGYFYLSYYDGSIGGITSFEIGPEGKYDGIYQYDGLAYSAVGYNGAGITAGNIFTAQKNESVTAAGFYTQSSSVPYNISVYTDLRGSAPDSGTLVASQDGSAEFAGYHAIDLETPVSLREGQTFSIVVTLKKSGALFYCDNCGDDIGCTYYTSYNVSRKTTSSSWIDCAVKYEQNTCIKALTSHDIAIDAENFPDGSFRDYINANIDTDGDGFLSENEIAAVNEINVDSTGIANLQGIEYFTELVSLSCGNNSLISLDLSKNKKLMLLNCEGNVRNLGEPSCGAWITLGINTDNISDLKGAEIKNNIIIPNDTEVTYSFDCGNNFTAEFTILANTSHSYTSMIPDDSNSHSNVCNVCGKISSAPHNFGEWTDIGDSTLMRICTECGYEDIMVITHAFGDWENNEDGTHSRICTECGYTETSKHNFGGWEINEDGTHSRICAECGYSEIADHDFGDWENNEDGIHSRICAECGYTETSDHVFGNWENNEDGTHSRICAECGYTEIANHNFGDWETNEDGIHSRICAECGYTEIADHDFGDWETNEDGIHSRICAECGYTETVDHNFGDWETNEDGTHSRICDECGYTETADHNFGDLENSEDGTHSRICAECGYTETADHNFGDWENSEDGTHSHICTECGYTEIADHNFGNWENSEDETHSHICAECGYTETADHVFGDWENNEDGTHSHTCTECGYTETADHVFGDWTVDIKGFRTRKCELCGCTEAEEIVFIRGDISGDGVIDSFDMVLLRRAFINGFSTEISLPAADINNDGQFSIADLVALQRYILGYTN